MNSKQKQVQRQIEAHREGMKEGKWDGELMRLFRSEPYQALVKGEQKEKGRERLYPPLQTILLFMQQVLNSDKSCQNIVARWIAEQTAKGRSNISSNTGPYCKSRKRLPEKMVEKFVYEMNRSTEELCGGEWTWRGRQVKMTDGTTLLLPDTRENQKSFPQQKNQKKGAGFPIVRAVAIMSLSLGTIIHYAIGAFKGKGTGEHSLLRQIFDASIQEGDVLLGDSYYAAFF